MSITVLKPYLPKTNFWLSPAILKTFCSGMKSRRVVTKVAPFEMSLLTYLLMPICKSLRSVKGGCVESYRVLDFLVGLARMPRKNRPFSGQQHQAQFGLNPALHSFVHSFLASTTTSE